MTATRTTWSFSMCHGGEEGGQSREFRVDLCGEKSGRSSEDISRFVTDMAWDPEDNLMMHSHRINIEHHRLIEVHLTLLF